MSVRKLLNFVENDNSASASTVMQDTAMKFKQLYNSSIYEIKVGFP